MKKLMVLKFIVLMFFQDKKLDYQLLKTTYLFGFNIKPY